MTILQILAIHPNKLGGFEDYIITFAKMTHELGHNTVYIFGGEPHPFIKRKLGEYDSPYFIYDRPERFYDFFHFLYYIIIMIRKYRPNIIQGQFHPHLHYAALVGFLTQTPVFITIHSTTYSSDRRVKLTTIVKANISSYLSQNVFAVSNAVKKDLTHNLHTSSKRILVLHNGVSLERYKPRENDFSLHKEIGISENTKIVLTVAAARPEKGLEYLIRAIPDIISKHPDTHFVFCGGGPLESSLIELANELGISEYVHFLGVRNDVPDLFNCSYISVLPSLAESFGLAALEAMAMMKAVVATNVYGIPEIIQDSITGLLITPGDSKALSESIVSLLENEEKARSMGIEGRKRIETHFDLNSRVLKEIKLYDNFINTGKI